MIGSLPLDNTMEGDAPRSSTPLANLPDEQLVAQAQQGNMAAYEALVKRYYPLAYRTALFLLHNPDTALDISQEAFVRVHRHLKTFRAEKPFAPWLYRIVKNLCFNYQKRYRQRWQVFSDTAESPIHSSTAPEASPLQQIIQKEEYRRLWNALHQLNAREREIIILKDFNDFSYEEIAAALEIPPGTVMSRLFYARKKLAQILGGDHETD